MTRFLALALCGVVGCATMGDIFRAMSKEEIEAMGTRDFTAPAELVFTSLVEAFKVLEFSVVVAAPERGVIKTGRKVLHKSINNGTQHTITHQYVATLYAVDERTVRVVMVLHIFSDDEELPLRAGDRSQFISNNREIFTAMERIMAEYAQ